MGQRRCETKLCTELVCPVGGAVLDLGCAPGSWLQVACQALGPRSAGGLIVGVDLQRVALPERHVDADRVRLLTADVRRLDTASLRSFLPPCVLPSYAASSFLDHCIASLGHATAGRFVAARLPAAVRSVALLSVSSHARL